MSQVLPLRSDERYPRYEAIINSIAALVRASGEELEAFSERPSRFLLLPSEIQDRVIQGLEAYYQLCLSAENEGASMRGDSQPAAWWVIRHLGWRPLSDVFSYIKPGDTIEIYDASHVQIFRSFNMFRCISYSLDELVTYDWADLYHRDAGIHELMIKVGQELVKNPSIKTTLRPFPDHIVSEKFSRRKRKASCTSRLVSPLFDHTGKAAGYMNVLYAEPIFEA